MEMNPKVSVLIPVYNGESTIESAVESILRQSFCDFEIVIINDGSTDSTPSILDYLSKRDKRINVIHTPQRGIISALNTGIELCRADLIARMDADDISHPQRLELQFDLMTNQPEVSVCSSLVRMFPRKDLLGGLVKYEEWLSSLISSDDIARDMLVESPVAHPSVMLRKSELIEIGGYQERGWPEDYDLWLRYHAAGKRFIKVPHTLLFWRQAEGRLTFADSRYSVENFLRAKAYYLARMLKDSDRPIVLWGAGKTGRRLCKHLIREGLSLESIVDIDTSKIGHAMRGIPIVGMDYLENKRNLFVIQAVGSRRARELIREQLKVYGYTELQDFICAA